MFEFVSMETWLNFKSKTFITTEKNYPTTLPSRSTIHSAGYDFRSPFNLEIYDVDVFNRTTYLLPTGIKWNPKGSVWTNLAVSSNNNNDSISNQKINTTNVVLELYPRSSFGFKYGFILLNTVGIIDADYYNNTQNEGHIILGFKTLSPMTIKRGDKICQGIIKPYLIMDNEEIPTDIRSGGTGSTGS